MGGAFSDEGQFLDATDCRVLVTGGTGLIGRGIQAFLAEERKAGSARPEEAFFFVSSRDGDLRDREATVALFQRHRPTHVIHLAARVGGLYANLGRKVDFFRENVLINDNVMECCRLFGVKKLVSCLSTCVFPDGAACPIDETMVHGGPPHCSNEGYSYAKRMIDVQSRSYRDQYGCNFTCVIPTNAYGPHDNFSIESGHVIPGLIHKCYLACQTGSDLVLWGSGTPLRQFIYSRDLGELIVWALRHYNDPEPIILSVDEEDEISIAEVGRMIAGQMGLPEERIVYDTTRADGQFKKTASNRKLRAYLPSYKFTRIEDGLKATCEWLKRNADSARGIPEGSAPPGEKGQPGAARHQPAAQARPERGLESTRTERQIS